jgi:hypothetical protein
MSCDIPQKASITEHTLVVTNSDILMTLKETVVDKEITVTVQVQKDDIQFNETINGIAELGAKQMLASSFDGQSETISYVISLTTILAPFLTKIIIEQIKAKKYIKVVYKGVQLQGISEKNAAEVIASLLKAEGR